MCVCVCVCVCVCKYLYKNPVKSEVISAVNQL